LNACKQAAFPNQHGRDLTAQTGAFIKEFKEFIARGNVVDLAVGIIIGTAFTAVVNSVVGDLVMPVIGAITSGIDFSDYFFVLNGESYPTLKAAKEAGAAAISYGQFINVLINFVIVSFVVFILVKNVNRLKKQAEAHPAGPVTPPADVVLLTEIRDLLKTRP
jgi:large conductance mechanosensitive channel